MTTFIELEGKGLAAMERISFKQPGFDCRKKCKHTPKGDHGIHCEEWFYAVREGDFALSITVYSPNWPDTVEPETVQRLNKFLPEATCLSMHHAKPEYLGEDEQPCQFVEGGTCYGNYTRFGLDVDRFWKAHARSSGFEQPESFWKAMERRFQEERKRDQ